METPSSAIESLLNCLDSSAGWDNCFSSSRTTLFALKVPQISTKGAQNQYCQDAQSAKGTAVLLHLGRVDKGALILASLCYRHFRDKCKPLRPGLNFLIIITACEYFDQCIIKL